MAQVTTEQDINYTTNRNPLFFSASAGIFVGLFGWLFTLALNNWALVPIFCRSADTATTCSNSMLTAWVIAYGLASIIGLFMLIRANVFRPLLVVVAVFVTLWAIGTWFVNTAWWVGPLWSTVLFTLAYMLYSWLASAKRFLPTVIGIVILVFLFRLLMSL